MKVCVERDLVIKLCEQYGATALKKAVESLPMITVSEDGKETVKIKVENAVVASNIGTLVLN